MPYLPDSAQNMGRQMCLFFFPAYGSHFPFFFNKKKLFVVVVCIYLFVLLLLLFFNSLYIVATLDSHSPPGEVTVAVCFSDFPHLILWSFPL